MWLKSSLTAHVPGTIMPGAVVLSDCQNEKRLEAGTFVQRIKEEIKKRVEKIDESTLS